MSKRLDIFEYEKEHLEAPVHTAEYIIEGKKYIVHSHFVGTKDIDKVLMDIAERQALDEVLYNNDDDKQFAVTAVTETAVTGTVTENSGISA